MDHSRLPVITIVIIIIISSLQYERKLFCELVELGTLTALQHNRYFPLLSKHLHLNKLSKEVNKNAFLKQEVNIGLTKSLHYKEHKQVSRDGNCIILT